MVASLLLHAGALALVGWPAAAIFVTPRPVAHGEGGNAAATSVALYVPKDPAVATLLSPVLPLPRHDRNDAREAGLKQRTNGLEVAGPSGAREPGAPNGTSYYGLAYGDEVKPALPVIFPDIRIPRSQMPEGVQGDVIVEVTIDERGVVVGQKLLKSIGYGIDERVIALLRDWRFRPATRNGVPIPSKHDVHFHFPG
jgi:TonB family protein